MRKCSNELIIDAMVYQPPAQKATIAPFNTVCSTEGNVERQNARGLEIRPKATH